MNHKFAEHFAADWIDSWNAPDLNRILSHYTDDFEMSSPMIFRSQMSRLVRSKEKPPLAPAIQLIPNLRFELLSTLVGVNSITLYYKGARGRLAAEACHFGPD
jgi:hypothetical protein